VFNYSTVHITFSVRNRLITLALTFLDFKKFTEPMSERKAFLFRILEHLLKQTNWITTNNAVPFQRLRVQRLLPGKSSVLSSFSSILDAITGYT
jgi:hypothetical protein